MLERMNVPYRHSGCRMHIRTPENGGWPFDTPLEPRGKQGKRGVAGGKAVALRSSGQASPSRCPS